MRVGVFGGSFDPVHVGHLILAESCRQQAALDKVVMVPAATSPLKPDGPQASAKHRVEMLKLAAGGHPDFEVSLIEIERLGISYTVDTLIQLRSQPDFQDLFLIIGADSLRDFSRWKQPERICELAVPLVVARRGVEAPIELLQPFASGPRMEAIAQLQFEFPWIEISSTEIREDIRQGRSIRFRVPRAVEKYIEASGLYLP